MRPNITKVCVIGAGVMGSGIAAQAANAGAKVLLLDVADGAAESAVAKMLKAQPAAFMKPSYAKRITPGTTTHDLDQIGDCDWIIEVIVEKLDVKQKLYGELSQHMRAGAVLSSNTSTLPLELLTHGMTDGLKSRFLITHFFNPPRYMRLLELITGPATNAEAEAAVRTFIDEKMGKSIVTCRDTPGFIANRIGTFWLHCAITEAFKMGVGVEAADAVLSHPFGVPKTGVFALLDLVGLDLMPHIVDSFHETLDADDAFLALGPPPALLTKMIADGYTGRKGRGGFYRLDEKRKKEVINLNDGTYARAKYPAPDAVKAAKKGGMRTILEHDSREGRYAWSVMSKTLAYAAQIAPDIAPNIESIDRAMRLGYNWKQGPFELIDTLRPVWLAQKLEGEGRRVPPLLKSIGSDTFYRVAEGRLNQFTNRGYVPVQRPEGVLLLEDVKRATSALFANRSASVWDLGDAVAGFEFHSKMNSLNPFIMNLMNTAVRELPDRGFKGMVIYNEGRHFSVGANLAMFYFAAKFRLWPLIRWILKHGQDTFSRLKYAPFPVVGAPSGMALGGGCEVLLHCDRVVAHAESYIGLVEAGVGIVPGWGGCKTLLQRWSTSKARAGGPMPPVMKAFETIVTAQVSKSAAHARDHLFLRPEDTIVMNRDRLLGAAKAEVLALANGYTPPTPLTLNLPGPSGYAALKLGINDFVNKGVATAHDATVAKKLAWVLSGADTDILDEMSEDKILKLERDAIVALSKTSKTRARVTHMLKTGKPLRN